MINNIRPLPPKFPESYCNCPETFIATGSDDSLSGVQQPQSQFHDCRYITERNLRIPAASRRAEAHRKKVCGEPPTHKPKIDYEKWLVWSAKVENARFTAEMDQQLRVL